MLVLSVVNIIDFVRTVSFGVTVLVLHCVCRHRARRYRVRRQNGEQNINLNIGRDPLIRELEMYYRRQELSRHEVRNIRKRFKVV
jgi:hypothetical protein